MIAELLEKLKDVTLLPLLDVKMCEAVPGDKSEVLMFMARRFEVGDAWNLINSDPDHFQIVEIDTASLKNFFTSGVIKVNKEHAATISDERMKKPGIVMRITDGQHLLIDGWHRAYNLIEQGVDKMSVYVITDLEDIEVVSEETAEAIREEE